MRKPMSDAKPACPKCHQKILQSLSTRCMYCGTQLPKNYHPSDEQKQAILARHEETNRAHDLAMEEKQAKENKKNKRKKQAAIDPPIGGGH
ncbi:MAG TPA: hypothetical protein VIC26_05340 [Marinagarivorans sp.]